MDEREEAWLQKPIELDTDEEPDRAIVVRIDGKDYHYTAQSIRRLCRAEMSMPREEVTP